MNDEQRKILEMVADGTLTQQDADRLLEALGPASEAAPEEEPSQDLGDRISAVVENIVDRTMGAFGPSGDGDLGEKISAAVEEATAAALDPQTHREEDADSEPWDEESHTSLMVLAEDAQGEGVHSLVISWVSGEVEVLPWEGSELRITETANRPMSDDERMRQTLENGVLTVEWTRRRFRVGPLNLRKHLVVEIPAGAVLRRVEVNSVSAPVRLEGTAASGELTATTVSGKLKGFDLAAPTLALSTVSGKLEAQGFAGDTVSLNTVSGKLEAHGSAPSLKAETVSGRMELGLEDLPQDLHANTVSGRIEATLLLPPEDPRGFTVEYESLSGTFECDFPLIGELKKHHGKAVFGDGSARINLETTSGKIELHRA